MFRFFRQFRQKLLTENRFSKYLLYVIGEIFLVVVGISIALQINNANEQRKLRNLASQYEGRLINDIILDSLTIHHAMPIRLNTIENIEAYFERFETKETSLKKALEEAIEVETQLYRYQPVNYTFEDMQSTGNLNLLHVSKQNALLKLSYFQNTRVLIAEKLMDNFYSAAESAEAFIERRSMLKANQEGTVLKRSGLPFESVHEMFGIHESWENQAQGLVHRQNMLAAMLVYHQSGLNRSRELLELNKETIEILRSPDQNP